MSQRFNQMMEVLQSGGHWVLLACTDRFGRKDVSPRLIGRDGAVVKGFGASALEQALPYIAANTIADLWNNDAGYIPEVLAEIIARKEADKVVSAFEARKAHARAIIAKAYDLKRRAIAKGAWDIIEPIYRDNIKEVKSALRGL